MMRAGAYLPASAGTGRQIAPKFPKIFLYKRYNLCIILSVRKIEEPRRPKMTNTKNITAEQVEEMLNLRECAERRLERAIKNGSSHEDEYRAECLAIERMLDIMGIEWTVTWDPIA